MTTSLSNHALSARPVDNPYEARLRGLSHQQLADRLNWLSWYQPGILTALMDYMEFSDSLAAGTDPDRAVLDASVLDTLDPDDYVEVVQESFCLACQAPVAAFESWGGELVHYVGDPMNDCVMPYVTDHAPFWP